jgi:hypothetical protein
MGLSDAIIGLTSQSLLIFRDITDTGQSSLSETPWRTWWLISRLLNSLQQWLMLLVSYVPIHLSLRSKADRTGRTVCFVHFPYSQKLMTECSTYF